MADPTSSGSEYADAVKGVLDRAAEVESAKGRIVSDPALCGVPGGRYRLASILSTSSQVLRTAPTEWSKALISMYWQYPGARAHSQCHGV